MHIEKWGDDLGARTPRSFAADAALGAGSEVDLAIDEGRLVLEPVPTSGISLEDLLARITPENPHAETDTGPGIGAEAW